jgi:putative ABC transport system permease protein
MFLIDDFLTAWRGLRGSPAFLMLASAVLALGLGATIFTYGVINTTMLKPPPFPHAERLYAVVGEEPDRRRTDLPLSVVDFTAIREEQRTFEDLAGFYIGTVIISGDDRAERYVGGTVTWNFMRVLGQRPFLGRDFAPYDDVPGAEPVVLLSHDLWRTRFNADPDIVGRRIRVHARDTTIIGVMPKGFAFPTDEALWVPLALDAAQFRRGDQSYEQAVGLTGIGRLASGVSEQEAAEDIAGVAARLATLYPRSNAGLTADIVPVAKTAIGDGAALMFALFGAVWLVLLIACANVASLIFVRANFRIYEAGMRVALGARRPRLILQMLAESVIVSAIGVAGGLVLAAVGLHLMSVATGALADVDRPRWWTFSIDLRVASFAAGAALLAALLSGIVPALRASRPDVMRILRDGGRTGTGLRLSKFTGAMVIVEIAMSAALLTGAGLMTRGSLMSLQRDYGASVQGFMSARIGLPEASYPKEEQSRFFERLVQELRERPGVLAAVASTSMPGTGADDWRFAIEGKAYSTRAEYPRAHTVTVTPGMFDAFRVPLKRGRDFSSADRLDGVQVAIVNEALVRRYFPAGHNPLGQRLLSADERNPKSITIIGVAPDINHGLSWDAGDFAPVMYRPVSQEPWRFMTVAIRTQGDPGRYGAVIREVVRHIDPDLAPYWVQTLDQFQAQRRAGMRLLSNIFTIFAGIAIILAAVGIYGVLAFATGQRNREIGVRRALGARDRQILATVMRSALVQLVVGLALGAVLAPIMGRAVSAGLLGLSPDDPVVYSIVFCVLVAASLLATWIPARRALRVQPANALRCE